MFCSFSAKNKANSANVNKHLVKLNVENKASEVKWWGFYKNSFSRLQT